MGGGRGQTHDKLWSKATIKAQETLVMEDLTSTINTVLVQQLANNRAPLILHSIETLPLVTINRG